MTDPGNPPAVAAPMRNLESSGLAPGIVVFDLSVASNSPAGSCVLAEVNGLQGHYPVTVFSDRFDGGNADSKVWVRVPLPQRPIFIRYWLFQVLAPLRYLVWRLSNAKPAIIQTTQGQFLWADLAYAHFCHRAYLKGQWKQSTVTGLRRVLRRINHGYNAFMERLAFRRVRKIVVPSLGLQRELTREYPEVAGKIVVISNPVDLEHYARPVDFDRAHKRAELGCDDSHVVFVFVALGDFARKGLGLILPALAGLPAEQLDRARLLVVGGGAGEIEQYRRQAESLGILDKLRFVGLQKDVRSYLWAADVLAFPSAYEIFSLAILQAAAAGLPPIVSQGLYGAEEFVEHQVNGWVVTRDEEGVRTALSDAISHAERLPDMSKAAQTSVQQYSQSAFVVKWNDLYAEMMCSEGYAR
ncbi:MAG: glycosyltransferase family 4 protein [Pseudomonadota bacterium]